MISLLFKNFQAQRKGERASLKFPFSISPWTNESFWNENYGWPWKTLQDKWDRHKNAFRIILCNKRRYIVTIHLQYIFFALYICIQEREGKNLGKANARYGPKYHTGFFLKDNKGSNTKSFSNKEVLFFKL